MSCTIDKILTDARTLLERLKEHDTAAESLIDQSAVLHRRVAAMREAGAGCADQVSAAGPSPASRQGPGGAAGPTPVSSRQGPGPAAERPDPSRLRPHVVLAQENTQIRDLQQENRGERGRGHPGGGCAAGPGDAGGVRGCPGGRGAAVSPVAVSPVQCRWMPRRVAGQESPPAAMGQRQSRPQPEPSEPLGLLLRLPAVAVTCCVLQSCGSRWRNTRTRWNSS